MPSPTEAASFNVMNNIWLFECSVSFGVASSTLNTISQNSPENTSQDLESKGTQHLKVFYGKAQLNRGLRARSPKRKPGQSELGSCRAEVPNPCAADRSRDQMLLFAPIAQTPQQFYDPEVRDITLQADHKTPDGKMADVL
ncbi:hypothetical protein TNCV_268001 [Trichonephila clavipes]|nr:hypothetical protein TNCV_268001 [Trichonephila clavipes]